LDCKDGEIEDEEGTEEETVTISWESEDDGGDDMEERCN
jgi:hypothetical protein